MKGTEGRFLRNITSTVNHKLNLTSDQTSEICWLPYTPHDCPHGFDEGEEEKRLQTSGFKRDWLKTLEVHMPGGRSRA